MAEIVGTVASVAQLIHLSGTLLASGYGFLSKVAGAPSEIRSMLTETAAINGILAQMQTASDQALQANQENAFKKLEDAGVLKDCRNVLKQVERALNACEQIHGQSLRNFGKKLVWPFKEKETKDSLQQLHRLRSLLADALQINTVSALRRIEVSQSQLIEDIQEVSTNVQMQLSREEAHRVISWVCPSSSEGAYVSFQNALSRRLSGTGSWFLGSTLFDQWSNSKCGSIWITGLPGSGKTVLCSSILEHLQQNSTEDHLVLYFFCDHRDRSKMSHDDFAMTITRQALEASPACLQRALELYNEKSKNGSRPFERDGHILLVAALMSYFAQVTIIVDALDEAADGERIATSLSQLHGYAERTGTHAKLLTTSRFDIRIEQRFPRMTRVRVALAENMRPDIDQYVRAELQTRIAMGQLKIRNRDLLIPAIQQQVAAGAGTLLHARLQLDYLSTAKTDKDMKAMIHSLPSGLDYTYQTLLCKTASQYPHRITEVIRLFRCLIAATTPLTVAQLSEILAMRNGDRFIDFDCVATDPYDALEVIAPFVIIDRQTMTNGAVKLFHYSLEEYLCSERIRRSPASAFAVDKDEADAWLASICLQYLTFDVFDAPLEHELDEGEKSKYSLLDYASGNWFRHMTTAERLGRPHEICSPYINWFLDSREGPPCYRRWQISAVDDIPSSPISFCIAMLLNTVAIDLLCKLTNLDAYGLDGVTYLFVASQYDNLEIVQWLLDRGASIDLPTCEPDYVRSLTPLHTAAEEGAQEIVEYLLGRGANPHVASTSGATPFYRACRGGNTNIVKSLKERGCDINARTWNNWTPILDAIDNHQEEVVDLLIEWRADLSVVADEGWTVLSLAASLNQQSVLEKLKRAVVETGIQLPDVDPNYIDEQMMAREDRREEMYRQRGAIPQTLDG